MIGKITRIDKTGWGFISSQDKPFTRIFFHWTSLSQKTSNFVDLKRGMKVSFELIEYQDKGWRAIKIEVINGN